MVQSMYLINQTQNFIKETLKYIGMLTPITTKGED